ncbi:hypothetical protein HHL22_10610 [Hymenobacter sp. RP-2-7]|uniref:SbsA Ig-like domain-containing protein n=1 Tax=Hymenobacter polaris TaxID=2682546 RepID=A0A7Y0FML4_9BACT|nr:FG-GAP-like repeat-containing protein [Hymenobacter polaris]NML65656.1 hypothetical protein [Hymenobacter polaris]
MAKIYTCKYSKILYLCALVIFEVIHACGIAIAQPAVTSISPPANTRALLRTNSIDVSFNQSLLARSSSALHIYSAQRGGLRTATTSAVVNGNTLSFSPSNYPFLPGETLFATITKDVASSSGNIVIPKVFQLTAATSSTGGGRFRLGIEVMGGNNPLGVATGDIDGDGDLDLLTANYGNGTVSVRLNGGDASGSNTGIFSGSQNVAVENSPYSVIVSDIDGDGDLDLLATNQNSNTVSIRLNGGNAAGSNTGIFSNGQNVSVGNQPNLVVTGDIDGDGDLDLLTSNYYGNSVSVRLNGGDSRGTNTGAFAAPAISPEVTVGYGPTSLLLGDVDGDGDLDLVVPNQNNTVSIRLNGGSTTGSSTGIFSGSQEVAVGNNPLGAALGDVDGDRDLDIVTANAYSNNVSVRLNGGDASGTNTGVFGNGTTIMAGYSPASIALGDIDGDGDLDMLTSNQSSNTVSVRLNGGDATGSTSGVFVAPASVNIPEVAVGSRPSYLVLADVDGDGDLDVLTANYYSNSVSVRLNQAALPAITSFTPASGPVGSTITINGTGFQGTTAINFSGSGATTVTSGFTVSGNGSQLTGVIVPGGASTGVVSVTTPTGTVTSSINFTVVPIPTLTSFTPSSGQVGTSVVINGTNLSGATIVAFTGTTNNILANNFTINSSGTQLTVAVPPGASTGPLSITTPGGTVTSAANFTVIPAPYIASFAPSSGVAGTRVTVQGGNLTGLSSLRLNGVDATASISNNTGTSLVFTVPAAAAASGTSTVTGPAGTGTSTGFTVLLRVASTSPAANARAASRTNSALSLTFSEAVTSSSAANLRVYSAQRGGRRAGTVSVSGAVVSFAAQGSAASQDFASGEVVSVSVPASVRSAGDVAAGKRVYQFTTATAGSGRGVFHLGSIPAVGQNPTAVVFGDVDGDGDLDLLITNRGNNTVSVRLNGGNATGSNAGSFGNGQNVAVGTNPASLVLGDVDSDGDLDMLVANSGASTVSVRLNGGDATGSNTGVFSNGSDAVVGSGPSGVALGDIDGDGDLDLLATNYYDNTVSVRLNGGDATGSATGVFSNGTTSVVGASPQHLVVGDVDGDGDLDFIAANSGAGTLSVRLNGGDATGSASGIFSSGQTVMVGANPYSVALADIDADGDLDLLAANKGSASVTTRLNGGDATGSNTGAFDAGTTVSVGTSPYWVAVADLDSDGDLDFVTANQGSSTVSVRLNGSDASGTSTGVFTAPSNTSEVTVGTSPYCVALGDIDGDGDLDVATANQGSNTATVQFNLPPAPIISSFTPTNGPTGTSITINGANLSGATTITFTGTSSNTTTSGYTITGQEGTQITGIVVPSGANTGVISVTTPSGTTSTANLTLANFTVTSPYIASFAPSSGVAGTRVTVQGGNLTGLSSLRLNGVDATASISNNTGTSLVFTVPAAAAASGTSTVTGPAGTGTSTGFTVLLRVASTSPAANARAASRTNSALSLTFSEAVTSSSAANLRVYSAQRGGRRAGTVSVSGAVVSFAAQGSAASQDFASGEVVSVSVPASVRSAGDVAAGKRVYQFTTATAGSGRGVFHLGSTLKAGYAPTTIVAGDIDGDGDLDLLTGAAGIVIHRNGKNNSGTNVGTFNSTADTSISVAAADLALGDVDGDGDLDIVAASGNGSFAVSVLLNGGDNTGSNTGVFGSPAVATVGLGPTSVVLADVDGDGDLDLLAACSGSNSISIRLNGGDASGSNTGVFYNGSGASMEASVETVTVGDVDGDGDLDVLSTSYRSSNITIRLNGGDATGSNTGVFSNGSKVAAGIFPSKITMGDVDGDGDLDLLTANNTANTVSVRLNGGDATGSNTGVFSNGADLPVGNGPQVVQLGDVDADGDLDFAVTNTKDNSVSLRLNGGNASGSNTGIFTESPQLATVPVGQAPYWLALQDVDNDGDLDLLTTEGGFNLGNNTIGVRLNQTTPLATRAASLGSASAELLALPTVTDGTTLHYKYTGQALPKGAFLAIYSMAGQLLSQQPLTSAAGSTSIKDWITGWYLARLVTTEGIYTARFYVP